MQPRITREVIEIAMDRAIVAIVYDEPPTTAYPPILFLHGTVRQAFAAGAMDEILKFTQISPSLAAISKPSELQEVVV